MKFHMIGIGGKGVSVVAELLIAEGHTVAGSDSHESEATEYLRSLGATIYHGQAAENVAPDAVVVYSSAIRATNPELAIARERGQEVWHRSEALAFAAQGKDFVAVAGTHGKTTTSGMVADVLLSLGTDPSWAIGGTINGVGAGGHLGSGPVLVAESDESDESFLNYSPRIEIITNIEADHLDHYGTLEAYEQAFVEFTRKLVPGGLLIVCGDDDGSARIGARAIAEGTRVVSYGRGAGIDGAERHIRVSGDSVVDGHPRAVFSDETGDYPVALGVVGMHNLLNAAGAWAAAVECGSDRLAAAEALTQYTGSERRFEIRGVIDDIQVIDDFAHHPTEITATLLAARDYAAPGRVLVLFQPHLYSRTRNFAKEFAEALNLADLVVVSGVHGDREDPIEGVEGNLITDLMGENARFVRDWYDAAREVARLAQPGDIVMTMGCGNVTYLVPTIISELEAR